MKKLLLLLGCLISMQDGIESLFSPEYYANILGINDQDKKSKKAVLLQNKPNPIDEATYISVQVNEQPNYKNAQIRITDLSGKPEKRMHVTLTDDMNDFLYEHGYGMSGTYYYSLFIDGKEIITLPMVLAN